MTAPDSPPVSWIDHHCHLGAEHAPRGAADAPGAEAMVAAAAEAGVVALVDVGTDAVSSAAALERARRFTGVRSTAGVHPHDARNGIDDLLPVLADGLADGSIVALGECGLDYHYDHSPREVQREVFAAQISLAHQHRLPLVIHTREAWSDTFDVLAAEGVPEMTVLHCFTGGPEEARRCLDLGAYLSFSGIVTFPSAGELRDAAAVCPLDRLLVETDTPYLAPVPHRGRANQPANVALVGAAVAATLGRPVAEVAAATEANTRRVYGLADLPRLAVDDR